MGKPLSFNWRKRSPGRFYGRQGDTEYIVHKQADEVPRLQTAFQTVDSLIAAEREKNAPEVKRLQGAIRADKSGVFQVFAGEGGAFGVALDVPDEDLAPLAAGASPGQQPAAQAPPPLKEAAIPASPYHTAGDDVVQAVQALMQNAQQLAQGQPGAPQAPQAIGEVAPPTLEAGSQMEQTVRSLVAGKAEDDPDDLLARFQEWEQQYGLEGLAKLNWAPESKMADYLRRRAYETPDQIAESLTGGELKPRREYRRLRQRAKALFDQGVKLKRPEYVRRAVEGVAAAAGTAGDTHLDEADPLLRDLWQKSMANQDASRRGAMEPYPDLWTQWREDIKPKAVLTATQLTTARKRVERAVRGWRKEDEDAGEISYEDAAVAWADLDTYRKDHPQATEDDFLAAIYKGDDKRLKKCPGLAARWRETEKRLVRWMRRANRTLSVADAKAEARRLWEQQLDTLENKALWRSWVKHDPQAKKEYANKPVEVGREPVAPEAEKEPEALPAEPPHGEAGQEWGVPSGGQPEPEAGGAGFSALVHSIAQRIAAGENIEAMAEDYAKLPEAERNQLAKWLLEQGYIQ